jgi:hypothetical protein
MSLAPSEQRALARIGQSLGRSDPRLAAMMATFAVLATRRRVIRRWTCLSPWRLRIRRTVLAVLALAAAALVILTMALTSHPGHQVRRPGTPCSVSTQQPGDC